MFICEFLVYNYFSQTAPDLAGHLLSGLVSGDFNMI